MANTYRRGRFTNENYPSNTGYDSVDARIIKLLGPKAPTVELVGSFSGPKRDMEETDDKFRWRTRDEQPNVLTVNGALASGALTLTADEIDLVQEGQHLYNRTSGEQIRIDGLDSASNTGTIERGVNGTTAAAIADNEELLILPAALKATEQSGYTPSVTGEFRQNYFCQFGWRMGQDHWSSGKPSYMLDPKERAQLELAKQEFLSEGPKARQMEAAIWYATGQAMGTNQRGYFKGVKEFNNVNTSSSVGALTYNAIMDHVHTINQKKGIVAGQDPQKFRLYGNETMLGIFNSLASSYSTNHKMQGEAYSPNLRVSQFETDFGTLEFMVINQLASGELHGVDFSDVEWVPANFRLGDGAMWTEIEQGPKELGYHATEWHYNFRGSIKLGHPACHFLMTGIDTTVGNYPNYTGPTSQ